jgi:hypothetical protein
MKPTVHKFKKKDIEEALFNKNLPRVVIRPFIKSCQEDLKRFSFTIQLDSNVLTSNHPIYRKLSEIVVSVKNTKCDQNVLLREFETLSTTVLLYIWYDVIQEFITWKEFFDSEIQDYVKGTASKFQWEIASSIGIDAVMATPFSIEQKAWIAYASGTHRLDEKEFMVKLVDSMKPWLNNELFFHVEKVKANKKVNALFEEQRKAMQDGSFGISSDDERAIQEFEQDKMKAVSVDDLDIIE